MAEIAEVKKPASQAGKPKPRSETASPYYDLEKSIEVIAIIQNQAGGTCDRAHLAPLLKYSGVKNGGFLSRVSAAKMFGLIEENNERLTLTDRAKTILAPVVPADAERAKVDAFMSIDLYKRVYEQFKGQPLPAEVGMKNLLGTQYGIVADRVIPALRVMMDSADTAGFFRLTGNRARMTAPLIDAPLPVKDIAAAIDEAAGTQLISIRMQKSMVDAFKTIAAANKGIGYQTLMKQILQRFIENEMKRVWNEHLEQLAEKGDGPHKSKEKQRKAA